MIEELEKAKRIALEIMSLTRSYLATKFKFMSNIISRFDLKVGYLFSVDGIMISYNPIEVLKRYNIEKSQIARAYMHMVLHCLFHHNFELIQLDPKIWDIACDIAVENIINELNEECFMTSKVIYQQAIVSNIISDIKIMTAEKIYNHLKKNIKNNSEIEKLRDLFKVDDHGKWYNILSENSQDDLEKDSQDIHKSNGHNANNTDNQNNSEHQNNNINESIAREKLAQRWKELAHSVLTDLETFSKEKGNQSGSFTQSLKAVTREKYNYEEFLKKFAVMNETMKINEDEFDYIFYTYGLRLYEKMPLIEPLEYKDIKQIKEFVVAIDTSASVQGNLVQKFLQKTYNILKQEESFAQKINLHIIQCDATIQQDKKIASQEEFDEYINSMKLFGFGGTDFTPVFKYVDELITNKEFINLKGLIYFTDGEGVYPTKPTSYNTAFVFIDDNYNDREVPPWATKLILQSKEI